MIELRPYQIKAVDELESGSILCGGVGSGKSRTAIAYYFFRECDGSIKVNGHGKFSEMKNPKNLYIITTAKKRDTFEWEDECLPFVLSTNPEQCFHPVKVIVDSWNNIAKYTSVKNAFFIFDEQRLVGSGKWVKSFYKIAKANRWILLSATPGDTWMDYIPVFVANGFYKNRTEFLQEHAVYSRYTKYPKVERFMNVSRLVKHRDKLLVEMHYEKRTISHDKIIPVDFNRDEFNSVYRDRWNIFENRPIRAISEMYYLVRKVVNRDPSRIKAVKKLIFEHPRAIIFYNFDYELEILREVGKEMNILTKEWNGHVHNEVPTADRWIYLVQYSAGAEGWNCIQTDTIIFYSQNYSYKVMVQAAGRIDRLNTAYSDLYYYHIRSNSIIDNAIANSLKRKKDFNYRRFLKETFEDLVA